MLIYWTNVLFRWIIHQQNRYILANTEFGYDVLIKSIDILPIKIGFINLWIVSYQFECNVSCNYQLQLLNPKILSKKYKLSTNMTLELKNLSLHSFYFDIETPLEAGKNNYIFIWLLNYDIMNLIILKGSMIVYLYDNKIESGQIANGNSVVSSVNDLLLDLNDNSLNAITGSFYLKANVEILNIITNIQQNLIIIQDCII